MICSSSGGRSMMRISHHLGKPFGREISYA
jgi:hypothetical protein